MTVTPVFTAHPTEVRRRAVVERETEIFQLMVRRAEPDVTPAELKRLGEDLFRAICLLWKARMHRPERITPADEIRNTLAIVRESILPALSDIYDGWSEAFETATPLTLGSWLGGDRDGHPGVSGETLKLALRSQARLILNHYSDEVRRLWFDMAVSGELTTASPASRRSRPSPRTRHPPRTSPTARRCRRSTTAWPPPPTSSPPAMGRHRAYARVGFVADLETVRQSIRQHLGERVIGARCYT